MILIKLSVPNGSVYGCDEHLHKYTHNANDDFMKRLLPKLNFGGTYWYKTHTFVQKACCLYHTCLNSHVMTYQVPLYILQYCELYMVPQTDQCKLYLSSFETLCLLCQESLAKIVPTLLRNSSRIYSHRCAVPTRESPELEKDLTITRFVSL